jgi:hypothetical protein
MDFQRVKMYKDKEVFLKKWWVESNLRCQTSRFHYGSKVPAVTITVFITILFQRVKMYKDKEVNKNVKNIFLSMFDVKVFLTFTFVVKLPLSLRLKGSGCHYNSIYNNTGTK